MKKHDNSLFKREVLTSEFLPKPRFRYSPVIKAGPFVFVSGLVALDADSGKLVLGGVYAETQQILANMKRLAQERGWSLEQLLVVRVFCADFAAFADVNRAWDEFFADVVPPTRTSVGVSALPLGALVEMEFQLLVDDFLGD
jgi:2-iminobutanoate/2-iminopropanoate deaminase|tara:strand:+ start:3295 stop:3720 length:426 start_codon:yes stop_codon:yes gene_type:complete